MRIVKCYLLLLHSHQVNFWRRLWDSFANLNSAVSVNRIDYKKCYSHVVNINKKTVFANQLDKIASFNNHKCNFFKDTRNPWNPIPKNNLRTISWYSQSTSAVHEAVINEIKICKYSIISVQELPTAKCREFWKTHFKLSKLER